MHIGLCASPAQSFSMIETIQLRQISWRIDAPACDNLTQL
jgi:hypothetical protein